ncbi:MAG: hypothetical protein ABI702_10410, partial [Burkholderiales bacterium]
MNTRRHVVARFAALLAIVGTAFFVWGPLPIDHGAHQYADTRTWLGVPSAANVLSNLPVFWLAVWGWCATRTSRWPDTLRLPWQAFHLCVMAAALSAGMYHAAPSNVAYAVTHTCMAGAFALMTLGMLAERVDHRFGSGTVCAITLLVATLLGATATMAARPEGHVALRMLQLVEAVPILLIPAGLLRLPGANTSAQGRTTALAIGSVRVCCGWSHAPTARA